MKIILTLLFLSSSLCISFSQDLGYLITIDGDTINGIVELEHFEFAFSDEPDFIVYTEDDKTLRFINQLISEYAVFQTSESGRKEWVNYYAQIRNQTREFLKPYLNGKARLYADFKNAWFANQTPNELNRKNRNLIYHLALAGEEKLIPLSKDNFIEITKHKFQNCPELVEQIGNKYFEFDNIEGIVSYYNRLCQ